VAARLSALGIDGLARLLGVRVAAVGSPSTGTAVPALKFGCYADAARGLAAIIGPPSPSGPERAAEYDRAMAREHCAAADSRQTFETANYRVATTSETEWWFVRDPDGAPRPMRDRWPDEGALRATSRADEMRTPAPIASLDAPRRQLDAKLVALGNAKTEAREVVALRLYTGPMFEKCTLPPQQANPLSMSHCL
jgi:hypothetical protein